MINKDIAGFRLIETRWVKEVNAECLFFEHEKSGARLLKIAADDPNKTFCIAFKTFPESDNGAPHIMEHSVLNGSLNFPVKSPFDVLLKGSLHTYMNALTGKDVTMYPVASMNDKDYFNLMHVYLDAVFNPLIYQDPRILAQEGWHYELEEKELPVVYKGVVYNEMKGSFSNPIRELWYQVFKNLFPDNAYGFESGGYPAEIPSLTGEVFLKFHKRYYHPENSYIFLYGNGDLEKELKFLDKEYLSKYEKAGNPVTIAEQQPFPAMKDLSGHYSIMEGDNLENQTYLSLNYVTGSGMDRALTMSLDVLCELLVNQESAPIRLALQKAGIGQDVNASSGNFLQNVLQIMLQNANAGDKAKFMEIVNETLKSVVENGLDKKEMQGVLNRMEFHLREGNDAQKGITYIGQSQPGFFFAGDPFLGIEYEKPLAEVKTALQSDYLENIIQKYLLNNPHALLHSLEPGPGRDKEMNTVTEQKLQEFKASLDDSTISTLISDTRELIEYQKREDTPEALAGIPMLDIRDIDPNATWYKAEELGIENTPVLFHEEFTNDVIYIHFYFDLRVLPQELIPYASLLSGMIGLLDTEKYSYGELNQELNIHTGGFFTSLNTFLENQDDDKMLPHFVVTTKAMKGKEDKLFELTGEILSHTLFNDTERIKTLLTRHQSQLDASIKRDGNRFAGIRLSSYYSNQGMFREVTEGLEYYWFINDLMKDPAENAERIITKLKKVASLLFVKSNLIAATTCDKREMELMGYHLSGFLRRLPQTDIIMAPWFFHPSRKNEGIATASKVQYVMEGYNFKKLGYAWNGKMRVLNQVLSRDWLQTQVRVIGGAYGGYASVTPSGFFTFNSYRDPNLRETLENYSGTTEYLMQFDADQKAMTRYIIGTISSIDQPLTASQKGNQAVNLYFTKRSQGDIQQDRNDILSVTAEDIRGYSGMIQAILDQNNICVYGNEDKINSEKSLFDQIIKLEREK